MPLDILEQALRGQMSLFILGKYVKVEMAASHCVFHFI